MLRVGDCDLVDAVTRANATASPATVRAHLLLWVAPLPPVEGQSAWSSLPCAAPLSPPRGEELSCDEFPTEDASSKLSSNCGPSNACSSLLEAVAATPPTATLPLVWGLPSPPQSISPSRSG